MLNTQAAANTFLYLGFKENIEITPVKLQKLVYFLYTEYLQRTGTPLFSEPFENSTSGPVLPSLHYKFHSFGNKPITKFARNATGQVEMINLEVSNDLTTVVRKIWCIYCSALT